MRFQFALLILLSASSAAVFGQPATEGWVRISTEDRRFSVEMPIGYRYFYDEGGFVLGQHQTDYPLTKMQLTTSLKSGTLLGWERYLGSEKALKLLIERDKAGTGKSKSNDVTYGRLKVKEIVRTGGGYHFISRYFAMAGYLYVVFAASRDGETNDMRRFLSSVITSPDGEQEPEKNAVKIADLVSREVFVSAELPVSDAERTKRSNGSNALPAESDPKDKKLLIIATPAPSYSPRARENNVEGIVIAKVTFSADGTVSKIAVVKSLPGDLVRQVVFSALRWKFLPREVGGEPVAMTRLVEFYFDIY
jgi:hypothetical protein